MKSKEIFNDMNEQRNWASSRCNSIIDKEIFNDMNEQRNWASSRCNSIIDKTIAPETLREDLIINLAIQLRAININVMRELLNET